MIYVSIGCLVLASIAVVLQYGGWIAASVKRRNYSFVPGVTLALSLAALGFGHSTIGLWALLPALVDCMGSLACMVAPFVLVSMWWRGDFAEMKKRPQQSRPSASDQADLHDGGSGI